MLTKDQETLVREGWSRDATGFWSKSVNYNNG